MDKYMKLMKEVPLFQLGAMYLFEFESGNVYRIDRFGKQSKHPLRSPLAGYLWLLLSEPGYLEQSEFDPQFPTPNDLRSL